MTRKDFKAALADVLKDNAEFEDRSGDGTYEPHYDPVHDTVHACWTRESEEEGNCRERARGVCMTLQEALEATPAPVFYPDLPRCAHRSGRNDSVRCGDYAPFWLMDPDGCLNPGGAVCARHGLAITLEYREKLGEVWTLAAIPQRDRR